MTRAENGGPAFPGAIAIGPAGDVYPGFPGMTLRDWFAGHFDSTDFTFNNLECAAKFAGLPVPQSGDDEALLELGIAVKARLHFMFADAMLAERSK